MDYLEAVIDATWRMAKIAFIIYAIIVVLGLGLLIWSYQNNPSAYGVNPQQAEVEYPTWR